MAHAYDHASTKQGHIKGNPYSHPLSTSREWKPDPTKREDLNLPNDSSASPALLNTLPSQQTYQSQGKRKDFHPHQSHFSKRSKEHYRDNQGYSHDDPRPQAVNTVGQACVKTGPTSRYETYTPLNTTCMAIYPSIAHLITKPKPRHLDYKPTKNMGTFCYYHEHNGHDGEKCITLRDHIEALAYKGKLINSSFTL
ncbi:hypothetical protein ACFX11_046523 [Malus domestica]